MDKSIADVTRSASSKLLQVLSILLFCASAAQAALPELRLTAESVAYEDFHLEAFDARVDADNRFVVSVGALESARLGLSYDNLSVSGTLQAIETGEDRLRLNSSLQSQGVEAELEFLAEPGGLSADLLVARQELVGLAAMSAMPPEIQWLRGGYLDPAARVRIAPDGSAELQLELSLGGLSFDSPDGRFAGESLAIELVVEASTAVESPPRVTGAILSGELLIDDFYRNFSDGLLEFSFLAGTDNSGSRWRINGIKVGDGSALELEGSAVLDLENEFKVSGLEINHLRLGFPGAYARYLESSLAPMTLDGLEVTGRLDWSGSWSGGEFQSGDLEIGDLSVVDTERGRFALTGLQARMRPGDHDFDSSLEWRGLLLGKINLGSGRLALDSDPGAFAITEPLGLEVLGGKLELYELKVQLPGAVPGGEDEPDIRLRLDLRDLDMEALTEAFGWPSFSGRISGRIPGVKLEDGVLELEGKILVDVFDGIISLDDLRIERPFGVLPSLAANVEAEDLDLELLTRTFSFGRISGRIDGYVRGLRMLDWKPVAFDAWLGTPENQSGSRGISRRAVNHLTTLGGGSATTALTSPLLKLFNNFSYKKLGFGCRMQNNVCEVRGVSEDEVSVLIMEGAGVPKITIRAYNRTVDWPQLLAHLAAASEGEGIKIGD